MDVSLTILPSSVPHSIEGRQSQLCVSGLEKEDEDFGLGLYMFVQG